MEERLIRAALRSWIRPFITGARWEQHSIEEWDDQYATSTWAYLSGVEQMPRYAIIEGWRRQLKPTGSVLDLGCGEGVLFEHLPAAALVDYTGVDLSQVAIDLATRKRRDAASERFVCADLLTFTPPAGTLFDVIVFNEVLYYVPDPTVAIDRYRRMLSADGLLIVSIFADNTPTWKVVNNSLARERLQTVIVHEIASGKKWHLGVYQARAVQQG